MTDAGKLPDKWELISEEGKKRNWKGFTLVGVTMAIVTGLFIFGLIQLFNYLQNSSTCQSSLLTSPDFTRNEDSFMRNEDSSLLTAPDFMRNDDDFLRFEKDGDIRLITVDSLISQTIVSVLPAENTTVEQSSGGFIVLKTQNGEIVVVNATNGIVTIYSHKAKVEVDTVLRNISATGADGKICFNCNISQSDIDGIKTMKVDIDEDEKNIIIKFLEGVTWVLSSGANVTIANYKTTGASTVMERGVIGMANTLFTIVPTNGSIIFERRGSDEELVLELTNDIDHVKARMRIRPSRLYVVEKSTLGEVHVDPHHKSIFVQTAQLSNYSGWPFTPKFVNVVNKNFTLNVDYADGFGTFNLTTALEFFSGIFKENSIGIKYNDTELFFKNKTIVEVRNGEKYLNANFNTGFFNMSEGKNLPNGERMLIQRGPLGAVRQTGEKVIQTVNTTVASISRYVDPNDFYGFTMCTPSWKVLIPQEMSKVMLENEWAKLNIVKKNASRQL